ncbi:hypothetical protein SS1G_11329 [Sclerotinia sclerotiorum 1980 UF-70]|uniref:Uncharacterized protein n=2 Tax=Sclerotinia sclerotiorum (strain ATCC 18683 / 1980 / Ss-1) TaxID=665079 RepID=A7F159_SCLS1|nr:hypothetical protein SS1G_11329 [Sclerotinia sclerotiorum 1980 UF-70]APA11140.1 hypothetical protein sscle_07g059100 [Sclerotinia sclerotiorum 1980 UF-70]EDN95451.1 hypothetical protein SS1G_11329 [Sclerotinia sclerotiorum 1980 UF-70]
MAAAAKTHPQNLPLLITPETFQDCAYKATSANTGLGLEVTSHFARLGAETIIMAVRNLASAYCALADIESSTGIYGVA